MDQNTNMIKTERLILTEMLNTDHDVVMRLYYERASEHVKKMMDNPEISPWLNERTWAEIQGDTLNYLIRDPAGTVLGRVCMQHVSENIPEIGIDLFQAYQNQGYGPEAITAFVDWYKHEKNVPTIKVCIEENNTHSQHVFKKLGASYVGMDTLLNKASIEKIKKFMPDADTSSFEIPSVLVFHL